MTGEEFFELWVDRELRQYIIDQAKRRSRRRELQEEYIQEAWLCISCAPGGYTVDCYCELADKAIYSSYWQNRKQYLLMRSVDYPVEAARHKTPERTTDNDKWFMQDKVNKGWRN